MRIDNLLLKISGKKMRPTILIIALALALFNISCYTVLQHPGVKSGYRIVNPDPVSNCTSCHEQILIHQDPLFFWTMEFADSGNTHFERSPYYSARPWWLEESSIATFSPAASDTSEQFSKISPGHPEDPPGMIVEIDTTASRKSIVIADRAPKEKSSTPADVDLSSDSSKKSDAKETDKSTKDTADKPTKNKSKKKKKPSSGWKKKTVNP
jgi:hypothetical protein